MNRHVARLDGGLVDLVSAILEGSYPFLKTDPACVGSEVLFEPGPVGEDPDDRRYRGDAAFALCQQCTAIEACQEWFAGQPPYRWGGWIIAGHRVKRTHPRKKKGDNAA